MGLAAATGLFGRGVWFSAFGSWHVRIAPGFSFCLACHFTLRFAVISVRSGEQEVSGATRSNKPFWILLMAHLTARPAAGTLIPAGQFPGGIPPGGETGRVARRVRCWRAPIAACIRAETAVIIEAP